MSNKNIIRFYVDVDLSKCENKKIVKETIEKISGVISVQKKEASDQYILRQKKYIAEAQQRKLSNEKQK